MSTCVANGRPATARVASGSWTPRGQDDRASTRPPAIAKGKSVFPIMDGR